jgi:hypothetical protein
MRDVAETMNARPDAGPAEVLYLGRSGRPPLRLKGMLAGRDLITLRAGDAVAGVEAALWRRAPLGWAVSVQIDAEDAAPAHAWTADTPFEAAAIAREIARAAFAPPLAPREASLTEAAEAACRRFAQIRLSRLVGAWLEETIDRLGDAAA